MKKHLVWIIVIVVIVALVVVAVLTSAYWWPTVSPYLPVYAGALTVQDLMLLIPYVVLALVALVELVVGLVLRQRSRSFVVERDATVTLHEKESELLRQEVTLLQARLERLESQLQLRDELVQPY